MMHPKTQNISGIIEMLFDAMKAEEKPGKYWYPLSIPTYGAEEVVEAIDSMVRYRTSMWDKVADFEQRFSVFHDVQPQSVMVNSGSSADLLLCFLLTNPLKPILKPGDEILAPIVTWPTQLWSPLMAGLKLKMVDADPKTLNMDMNDLEAKITDSTKAIFVVHLMGNPCDMGKVMELAQKHGLVVIEDCCEALGAEFNGKKVGTFGLGGAYSFFFSHHITTMEGGMIVSTDPDLIEQLKILRAHGWLRNVDSSKYLLGSYDLDPRYAFVNWGFNVRPTEVQAGFGIHQLGKLPYFNWSRNVMAQGFRNAICGGIGGKEAHWLDFPQAHKDATPAWFALPLMLKEDAPFTREEILKHLESKGIETRPVVAGNLSKQPAAKLFKDLQGEFPGADKIHARGFYIGLSPMQSEQKMLRLIETFDEFLNKYK